MFYKYFQRFIYIFENKYNLTISDLYDSIVILDEI
jgi:hypothetical protein